MNAWLRSGILNKIQYIAKRKGNYIDPCWILRSAQEDKASADFLNEKSIQWMCSENSEENFKSIS